jgi:hypothetical protein
MLETAFTEFLYGVILIKVKSAYSKWSPGINLKATLLQTLQFANSYKLSRRKSVFAYLRRIALSFTQVFGINAG